MLSLVLPTYNEAENLPLLLPKIEEALAGITHEVLVVDDDSPDGTWRRAQELSREFPALKIIRRRGERGLSSAVVTGFRAARGDVLAVMDADGQHDASLLRKLYESVRARKGVAIASRYIPGGGTGQWNERRKLLSRVATRTVVHLCSLPARDPLSGFFAIDRALFERIALGLSPRGFKILFDLLVRLPRGTSVDEIPYTFAPRLKGESKLSLGVEVAFLRSIVALLWERCSFLAGVLFVSLLLLGASILVPRAWNLRLLYLDAETRVRVRDALEQVSGEEGWLLSDLSLRRVDQQRAYLLYQSHVRGADAPRCVIVNLTTFDHTFSCAGF
ncbi:MAG: polyprenol monophosphomannose synthase [Candidatus Peribacteraceae bacterium]|nr:polyprenol monophosphomannose synthase [Candidatus Peribacteraceae bacterium]